MCQADLADREHDFYEDPDVDNELATQACHVSISSMLLVASMASNSFTVVSSFPPPSRIAVCNTVRYGLTLIATRDSARGNTLAYYPIIVRNRADTLQNPYLMGLFHPSGRNMRDQVGDVDSSKAMDLCRGIPYAAHIANEATHRSGINAEFYTDLIAIYRNRKTLRPGDKLKYSLRATCKIKEGDQIFVDYGVKYAAARSWETEMHPYNIGCP